MVAVPDLVRLARTLGDPTRLAMLALLMEGRALTAKELAYCAGVVPATASAHLRRLLADVLITVVAQGRHRYFRLASPEVAHCVESLMTVAPRQIASTPKPDTPLRRARFCYDHLAGKLGRQLMVSLVARRWMEVADRAVVLTRKGEKGLTELGLDLPALRRSRRRFACGCLDWSEREDHLGGVLGAALAERLLADGWFKRQAGTRCVTVTPKGHAELAAHFGITWEK